MSLEWQCLDFSTGLVDPRMNVRPCRSPSNHSSFSTTLSKDPCSLIEEGEFLIWHGSRLRRYLIRSSGEWTLARATTRATPLSRLKLSNNRFNLLTFMLAPCQLFMRFIVMFESFRPGLERSNLGPGGRGPGWRLRGMSFLRVIVCSSSQRPCFVRVTATFRWAF